MMSVAQNLAVNNHVRRFRVANSEASIQANMAVAFQALVAALIQAFVAFAM